MPKTTKEILDDWDDYKNEYIDFDKDWSDEHDEYLNKKWYSQEEVNELLKGIKDIANQSEGEYGVDLLNKFKELKQ